VSPGEHLQASKDMYLCFIFAFGGDVECISVSFAFVYCMWYNNCLQTCVLCCLDLVQMAWIHTLRDCYDNDGHPWWWRLSYMYMGIAVEYLWLAVYVRCCCRRHNLHLLVLAHKEFPFLPDPDCLFPKSSFLNRWQCATRPCRH